jgi:signal peptidase I
MVLVLITIVLVIGVRIFVFMTAHIPSSSMKPTLIAGDRIIINKMIPGARIIKDYNFVKDGSRPDVVRGINYRNIRRNDILLFNYPYREKRSKLQMDMNTHYIKRCVAVPGDTFYIDNGFYKVSGVSGILGNYDAQKRLSQTPDGNIPQGVFHCFPKKTNYYYWTMKRFGPLYVPGKNDSLSIDYAGIVLYKNLIEYETGGKIKVKNDTVYLNDKVITGYRFDMNYYFMTGDNVFDSKDSRYLGLVPEDHIIGKASIIYKSNDPETGDFRWDRFLKWIE